MRSKQTWGRVLPGALLISVLLNACVAKDAEPSRGQTVTVYTDCITSADSVLFNQFSKSSGTKVLIRVLKRDSILYKIAQEHYNSYADLILLHGADQLNRASQLRLWLPLASEKLDLAINKSFRASAHTWVALSKTPLVMIYDQRILNKDAFRSYGELLDPQWKGKLALQAPDNASFMAFRQTMRLLQREKGDAFFTKFYAQTVLPRKGDDLAQIQRIQAGQAQLAIIELSALAGAYADRDSTQKGTFRNIQPVFPGQRQKGCFFNVTGGGVYRYARNPQQAQLLLEFLAGKHGQYHFAAGRLEYPVVENVQNDYRLDRFGTFRGRFYLNKGGYKPNKVRR